MLPDRWKLVRSILDEALDLPELERQSFVARACASDANLASEVRALLAHEARSALVPPDTGALARAARHTTTSDDSGLRIGPFMLEARIATGGMGEVWRARRVEGFAQVEGLEQTVAIKLIKLGMDTEEMLRRFANERALLAGLQHDGIARLYDGGSDERGRPYLVMEFVDGVAIDRHCAEHALSIRERIELFLKVADAVQFAHERHVVHRDIKPSNILVARDGRPKLLDFGIAKVLSPEGDERTAERTLTAQRVLTPAYASPEQLRGESLSARSDVYSLGLVLWELCVGQRAFLGDRVPDSEIALASTALAQRTGSRRVARTLAGDLDTILAAACHLETARRYGSVAAFAADLRRFLADQPVSARRDSVPYRIAKFTRRNRLLVGSLSAIFLALGSATIVSSRLYVRAAEARDKELAQSRIAEERFDQTRELATKFLFDVHDSIRDLPGATAVREKLLSTAADTLDRLSRSAEGSHDLDADLFAAYVRLSEALCMQGKASLGRDIDAANVLDKAQQIAERMDDDFGQRVRSLAIVEYHRGEVAFAALERLSAARHFEAAYDLLGTLRGPALDAPFHRVRGDAAVRLAQIARLQQDLDEATCWLDVVVENRAEQVDSVVEETLNDQAVVEQEYAQISKLRGDLDAVLEHNRTAILRLEALVDIKPESIGNRARAAALWMSRAYMLNELQRNAEAREAARRAAGTLREIVADDPLDSNASSSLCKALYVLGRSELDLERWMSARDAFAEAAEAAELRRARTPETYDPLSDLALARTMEAVAELSDGNWGRGLERCDEAAADVDAAFALAPEGQRSGPPSFQLQLAMTILNQLHERASSVDPETSRRALEIADRVLRASETKLRGFEPIATEMKTRRSLLAQAEKLRAKMLDLAASEPR